MKLKEVRHKIELEKLRKQLKRKEDRKVIKSLLWYAFWTWTAYVTLVYFGFMDDFLGLKGSLLDYLG